MEPNPFPIFLSLLFSPPFFLAAINTYHPQRKIQRNTQDLRIYIYIYYRVRDKREKKKRVMGKEKIIEVEISTRRFCLLRKRTSPSFDGLHKKSLSRRRVLNPPQLEGISESTQHPIRVDPYTYGRLLFFLFQIVHCFFVFFLRNQIVHLIPFEGTTIFGTWLFWKRVKLQ